MVWEIYVQQCIYSRDTACISAGIYIRSKDWQALQALSANVPTFCLCCSCVVKLALDVWQSCSG